MTTTKITAHTYVCELPDMIQNQILAECKATFESLAFPVDIEEQLENVKGCRMQSVVLPVSQIFLLTL